MHVVLHMNDCYETFKLLQCFISIEEHWISMGAVLMEQSVVNRRFPLQGGHKLNEHVSLTLSALITA
jgi:hypothetical protein